MKMQLTERRGGKKDTEQSADLRHTEYADKSGALRRGLAVRLVLPQLVEDLLRDLLLALAQTRERDRQPELGLADDDPHVVLRLRAVLVLDDLVAELGRGHARHPTVVYPQQQPRT